MKDYEKMWKKLRNSMYSNKLYYGNGDMCCSFSESIGSIIYENILKLMDVIENGQDYTTLKEIKPGEYFRFGKDNHSNNIYMKIEPSFTSVTYGDDVSCVVNLNTGKLGVYYNNSKVEFVNVNIETDVVKEG